MYGGVINQTYNNIEVVLIDDFSPDHAGRWCDEYASHDSRIVVIHNSQNMGASESRNKALDITTADFIIFLDSDDWVDEDLIERLVRDLRHFETIPDILIFQECASYANIEIFHNHPQIREWRGKSEIEQLQKMALSVPLSIAESRPTTIDNIAGKVISTKHIKSNNVRFRKLAYREDGLFFQELLENASFIAETTTGLYHYRMRISSAVNAFNVTAPKDQMNLAENHLDFARQHHKDQEYMKILYSFLLIPIQMAITSYYFNMENPAKYSERRRACREYLKGEPFASAIKKCRLSELKTGFKLKALFMKLGLYGMVEYSRRLFLRMRHFAFYE